MATVTLLATGSAFNAPAPCLTVHAHLVLLILAVMTGHAVDGREIGLVGNFGIFMAISTLSAAMGALRIEELNPMVEAADHDFVAGVGAVFDAARFAGLLPLAG